MKQCILLAFLIIVVSIAFVAFAENDIIGTWYLSEVKQAGQSINVENTGDLVVLEIIPDKTVTMDYNNKKTYSTWSQKDGGFIVDGKKAEIMGDKLSLITNGMIMEFSRQSFESSLSQLFSENNVALGEGYSFSKDLEGVKKAAQSVFYVEMYNDNNICMGSGSGFICFDEHLFVTNQHVIDGAAYLKVWDDQKKMCIIDKYAAVDVTHDIAILQFRDGNKYQSLEMDLEDKLERGQTAIAMGSPEGFQGSISYGNISAFPVLELFGNIKCIQYTAPIAHGSSGGCLFNDRGKLIGITSAVSAGMQNIGFAVPIEYLQRLYRSWNKSYFDLNTLAKRNENRWTVETEENKNEDYTKITGGVVNSIVAVPDNLWLDIEYYNMNITLTEYLEAYEQARKTVVKGAPAIKNPTLKEDNGSWEKYYYIDYDIDAGIGTKIFCIAENKGTFEIPVETITISIKKNTIACARACLYTFYRDVYLLDQLEEFYEKNNCEWNNQAAAILTSEGIYIEYSKGYMGDGGIVIRNVAKPY